MCSGDRWFVPRTPLKSAKMGLIGHALEKQLSVSPHTWIERPNRPFGLMRNQRRWRQMHDQVAAALKIAAEFLKILFRVPLSTW